MKPTALFFLLLAGAASSASIPPREGASHSKRQSSFFGGLISLIGNGGKVPDPPGAAPRKQFLQTPSTVPGAKRVKIRSGPYLVPNMSKKSLRGHAGMLQNYPDTDIAKPCAGNCTILFAQAGLEYPDGSVANVNTGMWLHHLVQFMTGPRRWDSTGFGQICKPFLSLLTTPAQSERFFTSGNERRPYYYNRGTDLSFGTGYHISDADKFSVIVEFMNMNMEDKTVYLTVTYDILEGPLPPGWNESKLVWLDVDLCGNSDVLPREQVGAWTLESKPWKPSLEGTIIRAMGHMHDGGVDMDMFTAKDQLLCTTQAEYVESPEFIFNGTSMYGDKVARDHLSSMAGCKRENFPVKEMKHDQAWVLRGRYDYRVHEGNLEHGKQSEVMLLGIIIVETPRGGLDPPTSVDKIPFSPFVVTPS